MLLYILKFIRYFFKYTFKFLKFILAVIGLISVIIVFIILYKPDNPAHSKTKNSFIAAVFNKIQKYESKENEILNIKIDSPSQKTANKKAPFPEYLKWDKLSKSYSVTHKFFLPETVVFSGGGPKGIAYVGALKYIQEKKILKKINNFIGSSAGSIMCTFISLATIYEEQRQKDDPPYWEFLQNIILNVNFMDFIDNKLLKEVLTQSKTTSVNINLNDLLSCFKTLLENDALCKGTVIVKFFKETLKKIGLDENITLGELYKLNHKRLILVSCSLSFDKTAYFDYKTALDMPLVKAMRASMAIPYIFAPVKYNNDYFVDGGLTSNYPIDFFGYSADYSRPETKCIGIVLNSKEQILRPEKKRIKNIGTYTLSLFQLLLGNVGNSLNKRNIHRTIFIDCDNITMTSFDISKKEKMKLISRGYNAAMEYHEYCKKMHK